MVTYRNRNQLLDRNRQRLMSPITRYSIAISNNDDLTTAPGKNGPKTLSYSVRLDDLYCLSVLWLSLDTSTDRMVCAETVMLFLLSQN